MLTKFALFTEFFLKLNPFTYVCLNRNGNVNFISVINVIAPIYLELQMVRTLEFHFYKKIALSFVAIQLEQLS